MDLQADINWIISEISKVKDPNLIQAFKQLLTYRNNKENVGEHDQQELEQALNKALESVLEKRVKSHSEIRKKYDKWL